MRKKKIALVENFASDFISARLDLYQYLCNKGFEVYAIFPDDGYPIPDAINVNHYTYQFTRNSLNPLVIIRNFFSLYRVLRRQSFDVIHTFRFHPNLYGNIIGLFIGRARMVNHVTGLGIAFSRNTLSAFLLRGFYKVVIQLNLLLANKIIVQNNEDFSFMNRFFMGKKKTHLVKGSGVNITVYNPQNVSPDCLNILREEIPAEKGMVTLLFVSRLIREKGIIETIDAVRELHAQGHKIRLLITGWFDVNNPSSLTPEAMKEITADSCIIFLGKRSDVKELLSISDIFILPSYYREGIPRSSLEAMAMAKPLITTTMPGCNLTVENGVNGWLVPPGDRGAVKSAILHFLAHPDDIHAFGSASLQKVQNEFASGIIFEQIWEIYSLVLQK
jgi:glycosyltransferase involved in cell wall biosynthesis